MEDNLEKQIKSKFVTILAWAIIIFSVLLCIDSLKNIVAAWSISYEQAHRMFLDLRILWIIRLLTLFFLVLHSSVLVMSIGLLKRRNWGRLGIIVFIYLAIILLVAGITLMLSGIVADNYRFAADIQKTMLFAIILTMGIAIIVGMRWIIKKLNSEKIRSEF